MERVYVRCAKTGRYLSQRAGFIQWVTAEHAQAFQPLQASIVAASDDAWRRGVPQVVAHKMPNRKPEPARPRLVKTRRTV